MDNAATAPTAPVIKGILRPTMFPSMGPTSIPPMTAGSIIIILELYIILAPCALDNLMPSCDVLNDV